MNEDKIDHVAANELHNRQQYAEKMKTRVMYQYPKGEFRFPLIKDPPNNGRTYRNEQNPSKHPAPQTGKMDHEQTARAVSPIPETEVKEKWTKVEPKNSRPFAPTHIPSPVYGFHRPKTKEKNAPEFELTDSFSRQLTEKTEETPDVIKSESEKEPGLHSGSNPDVEIFPGNEKFIGEATYMTDSPHIKLHAEEQAFEEAAAAIESAKPCEAPGERNYSNSVTKSHHARDTLTNKELFEETPIDEKMLNSTAAKMAANERKPGLTNKTESLPDKTVLEPVTATDKDRNHDNPALEAANEADIPVQNGTAPAVEDQEKPAENPGLKNEVSKLLENRPPTQNAQGHQDAPMKKSKPRPHLPFNVLMLSQDKLKWERKKNRETKSSGITQKAQAGESKETARDHTVSYAFPEINLLEPPVAKTNDWDWVNEQSALLDETLENFNVKARVVRASQGPSVTRFEVQPDPGVKVNKITNLSNDIKLSMAARDIRMEAPIPGTRSIGIELPNQKSRPVQISEIIGSDAFFRSPSPLTAALGLDISGAPVVTDLRKMPHGLIAGATGSGKSVCINSILVSLLYKARPDELKLLLVDPKMVELAPYNHIPHLVSPVITDVKAATAALKWAVDEMEHRYELFVHANVRDIDRFNHFVEKNGKFSDKLPYIVIVIDELADLMMVAPAEVEESICRIAQKARACGIHLLIATQRPSVDVITGLIKANVPTRIAFSVSSQVDSRTVIDVSGAEKLLGRGDMLFLNNGSVKPVRLQGTFVSDEEIDRVIEHVRAQGEPNYLFKQEELLKKAELQENEDELFVEACEFVIKQGNASTSLLQRHFRIGYNRAARLMEMMEEHGVITGARGSRPRDVLIKEEDFHSLKDSLVQ
ncbi:DNA translocase FtsK [Siminovitchia sp. 179-K 8D1 HS]|uniref:DNA translocase FtsK n=1 Tax=Siminovitchia sp. 179-K 8D1 HS TaxID=3142385 RepID=UPI0039A0AD43